MNGIKVSFRLTETEIKKLKKIADERNYSVNELIRKIIDMSIREKEGEIKTEKKVFKSGGLRKYF